MNYDIFPENVKIDEITKAFIVSKETYQILLVNPELPDIYERNELFLLIYAIYPKLTRITCYPLQNEPVFKIKLKLENTKHETLTIINNLFSRNPLIHTTGLSKKNNYYIVENYYKLCQDWSKIKSLIFQLNDIVHILQSQVQTVKFHST